jgi:multidrug efflux system membrane fusion protein
MRITMQPSDAVGGIAQIGLALALLATLACDEAPAVSAGPAGDAAVAVRVERAVSRALAPTISVPGLVEPKSRIALAFRVTGFVERYAVGEGDRVEAGDVLAELDADDFERRVRVARAALDHAAARARSAAQSYERQSRLRDRNTSSEHTYDEAKSAHEMARAELTEARMHLEQAEDELRKTVLTAPVAGYVERRLVEEHELASARTPVLRLSQLDVVTVRAAVADKFLPRLRVGTSVTIESPQWPDRRFEAPIARIDVAADAATRTVPFEVDLANPDLALRPELVVHVEIATGAAEELILVPLAAVLRDAELTPFCFVASGDGTKRARRRAVSIGAVHGEHVVVTSGLEAGDRVITRGQHFLRSGDAVRVVEE